MKAITVKQVLLHSVKPRCGPPEHICFFPGQCGRCRQRQLPRDCLTLKDQEGTSREWQQRQGTKPWRERCTLVHHKDTCMVCYTSCHTETGMHMGAFSVQSPKERGTLRERLPNGQLTCATVGVLQNLAGQGSPMGIGTAAQKKLAKHGGS